MGALTPILYQGAIPVFADVDPRTCNVTAATIAARLSERTKAIVVTHLFGNPCEMTRSSRSRNDAGIPVIEDCAQAFLAAYNGQLRRHDRDASAASACSRASTSRPARAAWSSPTTTQLARRMFLFINKAWGYGDPQPDHYFLALNYRMTELAGAVALRAAREASDGRRAAAHAGRRC